MSWIELIISDAWNGRCNDRSILLACKPRRVRLGLHGETYQGDKKNRQKHANDGGPELEGLWLEILFGIFDCIDWLIPLDWRDLFHRVQRSCGNAGRMSAVLTTQQQC